jgi:hypothetical protein
LVFVCFCCCFFYLRISYTIGIHDDDDDATTISEHSDNLDEDSGPVIREKGIENLIQCYRFHMLFVSLLY